MTAASRLFKSCLFLLAALAPTATSRADAQGVESPRVPLRTAIKEINTIRSEYEDLYNKKDAAALTSMYLPDAVLIRSDGSTLLGQAAIGKALGEDAPGWTQLTLSSDTLRVFGNTAWDMGSMTSTGAGGEPGINRYLVVLRRGMDSWKISSVAVVPMTHAAAASR
jgi:ketosteroid isomerase-like protein